jgi:hypothetical protein
MQAMQRSSSVLFLCISCLELIIRHGASLEFWVRQINSSLRNVDFSLYQDLLLIITNEPIFTLHIARLFSSLISSSRALEMIISWVVSPTTLSIIDFTRSILSRLFTTSLMGSNLRSIAPALTKMVISFPPSIF